MRRIEPRDWRWDSGCLSLDFVNTRRRRFLGGIELLVAPDDLACWLHEAGLTRPAPLVDTGHLAAAVELREAINGIVEAVVDGRRTNPKLLRPINQWLKAVPAGPSYTVRVGRDGRPALAPAAASERDAAAALHAVATDAAQILGTDDRVRVRICADDGCSMRFYDRSNARSRHWCSSRCCTRTHMRARRAGAVAPGDPPDG